MRYRPKPRIPYALCLLAGLGCPAARGDDEFAAIRDGLLGSFALPLEDLLKKPTESEWANLFEGFSGNLGLEMFPPLPENIRDGAYRPALAGTLRYAPLGYWFAQGTFFHFPKEKQQADWDPDFTYSFGYDDWHPYTLHLVYENYGGNRLRPDRARGERITRYQEGQYRFGWKFPLPEELARPLLIEPGRRVDCQVDYNFLPRYVDAASAREARRKRVWSLGCRYPIYARWYFGVKFYYYPHGEQQQPWDPDYTYEIGYFDWRPGTFSLQYKNYSGNRYPWRDGATGNGGVKEGGFVLSWSWPW